MKKILIVGEHSYIGDAFAEWMKKWPEEYIVDTISSREGKWEKQEFSIYDIVFHVAGIAHVSSDRELEELYYKVNTQLTIEVAKKAKREGCKQFIFMSSIILYGSSSRVGKHKVIDKNTIATPSDFYGNSKLKADEGIQVLNSTEFRVVSIRPPMIYGKNSKGNYPKLARLAKKVPVFPDIQNQRSMLHIDNLCEFVRLVIDYEEKGIMFPQNKDYVNTTQLVQKIAEISGKKPRVTKVFNPIIYFLSRRFDIINKIFGSLVYDKNMSSYWDWQYCVHDFEETIKKTEE